MVNGKRAYVFITLSAKEDCTSLAAVDGGTGGSATARGTAREYDGRDRAGGRRACVEDIACFEEMNEDDVRGVAKAGIMVTEPGGGNAVIEFGGVRGGRGKGLRTCWGNRI